MIYQNKGVSQVYYGDKRIREIWLGNKRVFGSLFVHLYDNLWSEANTGEWLLAGGILYRKDKGKYNWHISARGVSDIIKPLTSNIAALKDGNLHFSAGGSAVDSGWSRLWTQLRVSMGDEADDITIGLDVNGRMKAYSSRQATDTITLPDTRFKKPGISVDGQWYALNAYGKDYKNAVVYITVIRSNVIDFSGDTYFNKQGEVRIRESDETRDRLVTTLSGTDIKFLSDTEFLHDGFIYTIGTDSFSKSEVGGFTDIGYISGEAMPCGIRDGVICKADGSVVEGSPENVTDLYSHFALTSDYKVYDLSSGSAVLYLDLKELTDA